ncbi:Uncharacterised protein [Klebsiella pneumoniae]|nr:Uncharacterised protein [Klebsiella pneumoniae]
MAGIPCRSVHPLGAAYTYSYSLFWQVIDTFRRCVRAGNGAQGRCCMNIAEEATRGMVRSFTCREKRRATVNSGILQTRWLSSCVGSLRILRRRHNEPPPGGLLFIHPLFKCRRGERHQVVMLPVYPCINHICPLLQHVGPLPGILGLVVNCPHALLFMRKRLLYPV